MHAVKMDLRNGGVRLSHSSGEIRTRRSHSQNTATGSFESISRSSCSCLEYLSAAILDAFNAVAGPHLRGIARCGQNDTNGGLSLPIERCTTYVA